MSPEQARGEALDGRADQYALAIVVYEMLTGTTPFRSDTAQAWSLVNAHITVPPPDPRQFQNDLPEHVVGSLMQAMAKMPGYRFATCAQFADALAGNVGFAAPPIQFNEAPIVYQEMPQAPSSMTLSSHSKQGMMGFLGAMVGILLLGGMLLIFGQKKISDNNQTTQPSQETNITNPSPQPPPANIISEPIPDKPIPEENKKVADTPQNDLGIDFKTHVVTDSDLQGKSKKELEIMRNGIYARYGWIFKRQDLQEYFNQQAWYTPGGSPSQRDEVNNSINYKLSKLEKLNAAKILTYEKTMGGE